jgi:hypothetical protein
VGSILFALALWLTIEVGLALKRNDKCASMSIALED